MGKPTNKNKATPLKSRSDRSHNPDTSLPDEQIIALVKFLARRAAQQDYDSNAASQADHHDKSGK